MANWCTIESDPGVFTELVETVGVEDVEFRELVTLEKDEFLRLGTVHAVIFLFKWRQQDYQNSGSSATTEDTSSIFFAKQTVNNACATQAIINALLNAQTVPNLGPVLTEFKSFASALPPVTIAVMLPCCLVVCGSTNHVGIMVCRICEATALETTKPYERLTIASQSLIHSCLIKSRWRMTMTTFSTSFPFSPLVLLFMNLMG